MISGVEVDNLRQGNINDKAYNYPGRNRDEKLTELALFLSHISGKTEAYPDGWPQDRINEFALFAQQDENKAFLQGLYHALTREYDSNSIARAICKKVEYDNATLAGVAKEQVENFFNQRVNKYVQLRQESLEEAFNQFKTTQNTETLEELARSLLHVDQPTIKHYKVFIKHYPESSYRAMDYVYNSEEVIIPEYFDHSTIKVYTEESALYIKAEALVKEIRKKICSQLQEDQRFLDYVTRLLLSSNTKQLSPKIEWLLSNTNAHVKISEALITHINQLANNTEKLSTIKRLMSLRGVSFRQPKNTNDPLQDLNKKILEEEAAAKEAEKETARKLIQEQYSTFNGLMSQDTLVLSTAIDFLKQNFVQGNTLEPEYYTRTELEYSHTEPANGSYGSEPERIYVEVKHTYRSEKAEKDNKRRRNFISPIMPSLAKFVWQVAQLSDAEYENLNNSCLTNDIKEFFSSHQDAIFDALQQEDYLPNLSAIAFVRFQYLWDMKIPEANNLLQNNPTLCDNIVDYSIITHDFKEWNSKLPALENHGFKNKEITIKQLTNIMTAMALKDGQCDKNCPSHKIQHQNENFLDAVIALLVTLKTEAIENILPYLAELKAYKTETYNFSEKLANKTLENIANLGEDNAAVAVIKQHRGISLFSTNTETYYNKQMEKINKETPASSNSKVTTLTIPDSLSAIYEALLHISQQEYDNEPAQQQYIESLLDTDVIKTAFTNFFISLDTKNEHNKTLSTYLNDKAKNKGYKHLKDVINVLLFLTNPASKLSDSTHKNEYKNNLKQHFEKLGKTEMFSFWSKFESSAPEISYGQQLAESMSNIFSRKKIEETNSQECRLRLSNRPNSNDGL